MAPTLCGEGDGDPLADPLEGSVLQQPGEQQVAGFEQGEVFGVVHLALGQQPGGFEVEQGGGDHDELGGLFEIPPTGPVLGLASLDVGQELVGDNAQRDLGDVEPVP